MPIAMAMTTVQGQRRWRRRWRLRWWRWRRRRWQWGCTYFTKLFIHSCAVIHQPRSFEWADPAVDASWLSYLYTVVQSYISPVCICLAKASSIWAVSAGADSAEGIVDASWFSREFVPEITAARDWGFLARDHCCYKTLRRYNHNGSTRVSHRDREPDNRNQADPHPCHHT